MLSNNPCTGLFYLELFITHNTSVIKFPSKNTGSFNKGVHNSTAYSCTSGTLNTTSIISSLTTFPFVVFYVKNEYLLAHMLNQQEQINTKQSFHNINIDRNGTCIILCPAINLYNLDLLLIPAESLTFLPMIPTTHSHHY